MNCNQKSFKMVWRRHQLLTYVLANGQLPRVSRLSRPTFRSAKGAYKRHQEYIYSYQLFRKPWFDTNVSLLLFLHVTLPTLDVSLLRVVLFFLLVLRSMLLNYKKKIVLRFNRLAAFPSQCQWTRIFLSLATPMAMGTQLGLKRHWESHYSSMVSILLSVNIFTGRPSFLGASGAHKQHQGYNYL